MHFGKQILKDTGREHFSYFLKEIQSFLKEMIEMQTSDAIPQTSSSIFVFPRLQTYASSSSVFSCNGIGTFLEKLGISLLAERTTYLNVRNRLHPSAINSNLLLSMLTFVTMLPTDPSTKPYRTRPTRMSTISNAF